ncbi:hypothetical protein [Oceanospirillum beijerinckii]|uniref:hypothetical protein n=1 Tax=Oceanospirillum beijerinckii TaxID=64976 RepID=UPI0004888BE9|nr:hypothetical protein [Oceanospirillum beijerinckii]
MAMITKRETAAGKTKYKADIRIKKAGRIIHRESRTFDRKKLAEEWANKRELELQDQSGLEKVRHAGTLIGDVVEQRGYLSLLRAGDAAKVMTWLD